VRLLQLEFKKQSQAWKNLLLRGYDSGDQKKYYNQFLEYQQSVKSRSEALRVKISDQEASLLLKEFLDSYGVVNDTRSAAEQLNAMASRLQAAVAKFTF
jgi:hypothetical protein